MCTTKTIITLVLKLTTSLSLFLGGMNCSFSSSNTIDFGSTTLSFRDFVCQGNDVIRNMMGISDLRCSYICNKDPSCVTFFHHQSDDVCVTCSAYFTETTRLTAYVGMRYYRKQPLWNSWGSWSQCTATCGNGTRTRTRTCHPISLVPCIDGTQNSDQCNAYECVPYAKTCTEWASKGLNFSANVQIDPLGSGPVTVYCNFDSQPGKALTVLDHNQLQTRSINGYVSYSQSIQYDVGFEIAKKIADISTGCKQFIEWRCKHAFLLGFTFWENRHGNQSAYFTGSPPPGKYCACGEINSCADPTMQCNCDSNDYVWRVDGGNVTNKNDLPITGYTAGDTEASYEAGYMTIGPLLCY